MSDFLRNLLLHIVNATILFVIIRFLVYKPVRKFMRARADRIAASLEQAGQARTEAEQLRTECEQRAAAAEDTARAQALEITASANASAKAMAEAAQRKAADLLDRAQAAAQAEHDKAMEGLRGEVIDLAAEMAAQILRQSSLDNGDEPREATDLLDQTQTAAQAEHDKAMESLRSEVIDLAAEMAAQILRQNSLDDGGEQLG